MGHAVADDGGLFVVARFNICSSLAKVNKNILRYKTPGNYMGQFAENVPNLLN